MYFSNINNLILNYRFSICGGRKFILKNIIGANAFYKLEQYDESRHDADVAIQCDPQYIKAYMRYYYYSYHY